LGNGAISICEGSTTSSATTPTGSGTCRKRGLRSLSALRARALAQLELLQSIRRNQEQAARLDQDPRRRCRAGDPGLGSAVGSRRGARALLSRRSRPRRPDDWQTMVIRRGHSVWKVRSQYHLLHQAPSRLIRDAILERRLNGPTS
jgi:hypothetical protein